MEVITIMTAIALWCGQPSVQPRITKQQVKTCRQNLLRCTWKMREENKSDVEYRDCFNKNTIFR